MATPEPPLKKRRQFDLPAPDATEPVLVEESPSSPRYASDDMEMSPEPPQQPVEPTARKEEPKAEVAAGNAETQMDAAGAVGSEEDELHIKRRNRREISSLYKAYRALKACLARHPTMGPELDRELEKAYYTLLKLANGCTSVRRIAAELIPRYAVFCPTALDAASRVIIQICEWTSSVLMQEEDNDAIIAETAEACFSGLVELSVAAKTAASSFLGLGAMCAGVCRAVASYLLSQFNGHELCCEENPSNESLDMDGGSRLINLISRSLWKLFSRDPENVFASCFELLQAPDSERRKHGQHFLAQILLIQKNGEEVELDCGNSKIPEEAHEPSAEDRETSVEASQKISTENRAIRNTVKSLIAKVIHPNPGLERCIVSMVRSFRKSGNAEIMEESLPKLLMLIKSLQTFSPSDLELASQEEVESLKVPEEEKIPSRIRSRVVGGSNKSEDSYNMSEIRSRSIRSVDHRLRKGFTSEDTWYEEEDSRPRKSVRSVTVERSSDVDMRNRDRKEPSAYGKADDSAWSSGWRLSKESKNSEKTGNKGETWVRNKEVTGYKKETSSALSSPELSSLHKSSPNQASVSYRDGDPAAMDVFTASEHLWVGSLGSTASESTLRSQFSIFGHLEGVSLFRDQGFALVEFRNIKDAVEAREEMQGSTIWGKPLRIKFLDPGLASRGGAALGGSCHVWIGRISSQIAKEELLKDLTSAGLKPPISVATLITPRALLLEFDAPEEAAAVMLHVRQRRKEISSKVERSSAERGSSGNRHLWVGRVDPLVCEEEILSAFSQYGELTGWKFIRQSGCCFIDFRSCEAATNAKVRLNGIRFGSQSIIVEYKNNLQRNSASSPPSLYSPPGSSSGGKATLATALESLCSKFSLGGSGVGTPVSGRSRSNKFGGARDSDRVPTNTLWIGLPDAVTPGFMNENQLKCIFNVASDGVGRVTRVRSARTSRGPCRFVEFDAVEAAATALQNISGHFDPGIQIEFSNSAISLQQTDHPHYHLHSQPDHPRRRDKGSSRGWDWEQEYHEDYHSPSTEFDEYQVRGQRVHGWGDESRGFYESSSEFRDENARHEALYRRGGISPSVVVRGDSTGSTIGSPLPGHGLVAPPSLEYQSTPGRTMVLHSQPPPLAPLPVPNPPGFGQLDRVSSASSWQGSSPLDPISPAASTPRLKGAVSVSVYAGETSAFPHASLLQSPLTPGVPNVSASAPPVLMLPASPPPPLPNETPPPPPLSPPPPPSPPPPLPISPPPELATDPSGHMQTTEQHFWRGPLCKSGLQYCEVVVYRQESSCAQYGGTLREPTGWPDKLDVTKRADFKSLKQTFNTCRVNQREVCRLYACPSAGGENYNGFLHFIDYLRQRDRAGVVKIGGGQGLWPRLLYILPWPSEASAMLSVPAEPADSLICVVLPCLHP